MPPSRKKVIVRRFAGDLLSGYLTSSQFLEPARENNGSLRKGDWDLHLLDLSGRVVPVYLGDIKMVCYVRDFNLGDTRDPERLLRRSFLARPRGEGLWVRITFRSGDVLEGLAPADLALADDLVADLGVQLTPPDTRSNTQRVYIPRSAMAEFQVLAVVSSRTRQLVAAARSSPPQAQEELFRAVAQEAGTQSQEP